jgi:hypothetical protein
MLREIAKTLNNKEYANFSRLTHRYTRRTEPIGLSATKIGPRTLPPRRTVINRSRTAQRPYKISQQEVGYKFKMTPINYKVPVAYKNTKWTYYDPGHRHHVIFFNTINGPPFMIDPKTGARKPVPPRVYFYGGTEFRKKRKESNTWNAYLKRAEKASRYAKGAPVRNAKYQAINKKVRNYAAGNKNALANTSMGDLIWWGTQTKGHHYHKAANGKWYEYAGGNLLTKNKVLQNINGFARMRRESNEPLFTRV